MGAAGFEASRILLVEGLGTFSVSGNPQVNLQVSCLGFRLEVPSALDELFPCGWITREFEASRILLVEGLGTFSVSGNPQVNLQVSCLGFRLEVPSALDELFPCGWITRESSVNSIMILPAVSLVATSKRQSGWWIP